MVDLHYVLKIKKKVNNLPQYVNNVLMFCISIEQFLNCCLKYHGMTTRTTASLNSHWGES